QVDTNVNVTLNGQLATLHLTAPLAADNVSLEDLATDLDGLIAASVLAGKLDARVADDRIQFVTTAVGSAQTVSVSTSQLTSTSITVQRSDGVFETRPLFSSLTAGGLGFSTGQSAQGGDRSFKVVENPEPGTAPTTGPVTTDSQTIGTRAVLLPVAGSIVSGVDFGNLLIVDLDMGDDRTVNEGDGVTITPTIGDPLHRENPPFPSAGTVA